jgi:hypothetical protein
MSQQKPSQPKNSAQISKALKEHQLAKAEAEFEKLRKAQNDRSRTERLEKRRESSLPTLIKTPEASKPPKSSKSSLNIRTPSPSPSDSARFEINVTPTFDVKFDDKNNESRHITDEPVEILIKNRDKDTRDKGTEQPIKIVINQPDSDSDPEQRENIQRKKDADFVVIAGRDGDNDEDKFRDTRDKTNQKNEPNTNRKDHDIDADNNKQDDVFL